MHDKKFIAFFCNNFFTNFQKKSILNFQLFYMGWKKCVFMYITSIDTNQYNVSMGKNNFWKRLGQKILDQVPEHVVKDGKKSKEHWDKFRNVTSNPMWNRGITGVTAVVTQPAIDYYNHRVDDETRTVSRNRTFSKIVAGTLVGMFVVRGPVYKLVEKMTNPFGKTKFSKALLPKKLTADMLKNVNDIKNYRSALSMFIALLVMCYTNFKLDAPLTNYFTNRLNERSKLNIKGEEAKSV